MMIGNIGKMQYRMILEQIKRKMKEGKKIKPVAPTDNNGELNHGQIPNKKSNEKQNE